MTSCTLRAMRARVLEHNRDEHNDADKWTQLIDVAIVAVQTAVLTLKDMIQEAQTDEEYTAFSRFTALAQGNEVQKNVLSFDKEKNMKMCFL